MNPRAYHERISAQADALCLLRGNVPVNDVMWKSRHPGSRIAPVVEKLRNAHGFKIGGEGSVKSPYRMADRWAEPGLVAVTDTIKAAYYASEHWRSIRERRLARDSYRCVLCGDGDSLVVHHVRYLLFYEPIEELMTVCEECHGVIHESAKLKFPSGMRTDLVRRLGIEPVFEKWLLAEKVEGQQLLL